MKICMIGHKEVPSRRGGVEIAVEELSTRMAKLGNEVTLYNRKRKNSLNTCVYKGVNIKTIFTINTKCFDAIIYSYLATKRIKKEKYDIVHFHAEGPCLFLSIFGKLKSKKRGKTKIIVTIHGLDWKRKKWGLVAKNILLIAEKKAVKYADEIIVLSKSDQKYFMDKYGRRTNLIPNGINIPVYRDADIIKANWGLDSNSYILFLARIVPEKGIKYLVNAWKSLSLTEKSGYKLVIAGDSSHSNKFLSEIKLLAKGDSTIVMTGFVEGNVLNELYSNAFLYVLPSEIEGMSIGLLEAESYGNKCLISNIKENLEVANENCFSFISKDESDLKEKLKIFIKENKKSKHVLATTNTWDEIVLKTLNLYNNNN